MFLLLEKQLNLLMNMGGKGDKEVGVEDFWSNLKLAVNFFLKSGPLFSLQLNAKLPFPSPFWV